MSASLSSKPTHIEARQRVAPVLNGRPFEQRGASIHLYHHVFTDFENGLEADDPIPRETRENVQKFIKASSAVYAREDARFDAIELIINDLLGWELIATRSKKVTSDGVIRFSRNRFTGYLLILEVKNEIGTGGSDPFLQASFAYQLYHAPQKCMWFGSMLVEYG
jgi:hypothetical protein